jgi:predicted nucleic acid-binding protein
MNVLVDTPVWSLAFRRKKEDLNSQENTVLGRFTDLIDEFRVVIIGPIRQELLSGISSKAQYELLMKKLRAFEDLPLTTADYETAAGFYNTCKKRGIQGSAIDFLICAAAYNNRLALFTLDKDFTRLAPHTAIRLFQ